MLQPSTNFSDLPRRILSGGIFAALAFFSLSFGGFLTVIFLSVCLAVLGWEILYIFAGGSRKIIKLVFIVPGMLFVVPILNFYDFYPILALIVFVLINISLNHKDYLKFICIFYVGISFVLFQEILFSVNLIPSLYYILFIIAIVGSSDMGGYFVGRVVGGAKIYKSISPNKTWSGSLGGILLSIFVSLIVQPVLDYSLLEITGLGCVLAMAAQLGDFFESWLKRKYKVKDSGFLLPGHGGVFDRLDGLLAAVPVYSAIVYFY